MSFSPHGAPDAEEVACLTLDSGLTVRPWEDGDDLALLEVWGDPENPMHHQDRSLLRPSSDKPWSRTVVAEDQGVPVAAATLLRSSLHPDRLSFYAEVAPEHRRRGVAAELLNLLQSEAENCQVQSLKARCGSRTAAQCFLRDNGFQKVQASRRVVVRPGALPTPDLEADQLDLEDIATGSVELSSLVAEFYNSIHTWDRSEMTVGKAQQLLLSPETGASGAVVLRDRAPGAQDRILAFAISYTPERGEDPSDVLLGWNPELEDDEAEAASQVLLAMLSARFPVTVEVDDSMAPLKRVARRLIDEGAADSDFEAMVYARDH
ncbi:MAG: GNAT family N-acetyltransferase [Nesterenkonia sp.]|uniref:GNAT family N-acetyltransferase n=1 Tax=Nesterenkonia marinintestina TaxID=2979865 RepID=UPI0021C05303|nr:GNAT family N-acetyltransferase [Nesterenkonia sp. GX14115]MDO5492404.1 GNAT family N-acetyltransferase [Nesterenkonia sp.]